MHDGPAKDAVNMILNRCSELFGSIATEKATIRLVKSDNRGTIIKCRLDQLNIVLVSIALTDQSMVTLSISGSIKRLQRKMV
jgi:RNase P/RNase MRP subunit POP5